MYIEQHKYDKNILEKDELTKKAYLLDIQNENEDKGLNKAEVIITPEPPVVVKTPETPPPVVVKAPETPPPVVVKAPETPIVKTTETPSKQIEKLTIGMIFILIILFGFFIAGIVGFIMSLICFGYEGETSNKIVGLLISFFTGPFYWIYYAFNTEYCYKSSI